MAKETAEKLRDEAEKAAEKAKKPLPTLAQPTVTLPVEIRQAVALRCRETGESFSQKSTRMWIDLLKAEKRVATNLEIDLSVARGGGLRKKLEEKEGEIEELRRQLGELKAKKGG